jgi:hypothetical protein
LTALLLPEGKIVQVDAAKNYSAEI